VAKIDNIIATLFPAEAHYDLAAQTPITCPMQERIIQASRRDNLFLQHKIEPVQGYIDLPPGPGLSMVLDEDTIVEVEEIGL